MARIRARAYVLALCARTYVLACLHELTGHVLGPMLWHKLIFLAKAYALAHAGFVRVRVHLASASMDPSSDSHGRTYVLAQVRALWYSANNN